MRAVTHYSWSDVRTITCVHEYMIYCTVLTYGRIYMYSGKRNIPHIFASVAGSATARQLTRSWSFSMKTKVRMVCGL